MSPVDFQESNIVYGPPEGMAESQCMSIRAFRGELASGPLDGVTIVVTAWRPTDEERRIIAEGGDLYLTCVGGLPPHLLSVSFANAVALR